ncbi:MAG: hydantoinase/oxoprolinase family protein [Chloroflexi bacterium]|nr:hydantoinase/oxoprolinase family protein [Chloroflexota bacterium]
MSEARFRLGVDIGGTFTDATLVDESTGQVWNAKVSSTPGDPSQGFLTVTQQILDRAALAPETLRYVIHATTVATNAIIEGKVAPTALITTEGFRDILEIARQIRPSLYDTQFEKPTPLVPRDRCFGVRERLDANGRVVTPLEESAVPHIASIIREAGIESVAVCFLHSYLNAQHEQRAGEILRAHEPDIAISLSSEVAPEIREYFRASTTVINAALRPIVSRYLENIETRLRSQGISSELLVMQSSGGLMTFGDARRRPVFMVESGPAAGVITAAHLGESLGHHNVISFDMGGTTAKVGLVQDGTPRITKDYEVGSVAQPGSGGFRAGGYPIRTPVIDLVEIGAGGGSIAWIDPGGVLRVGPRSAGADPGPACYGQGGTEPTVTDANLVLGRLNPGYLLGGDLTLESTLAHAAIEEHIAKPLGLDVVRAAHSIVEIANVAMINALRLVSVQRGHDPREFALTAFGGAGPLHANRLAHEMNIPATVIPTSPGTASALGLLVTDITYDYATTLIERVDRLEPRAVADVFTDLRQQGTAALAAAGVATADMAFVQHVDLRYVGQSYELTLPYPDGEATGVDFGDLLHEFHGEHNRVYGHSVPGEPVETVNLRLTALGTIVKPPLLEKSGAEHDLRAAQRDSRPVYFGEVDEFVDCPIYDRYRLSAGTEVPGPAIVEEYDSTTVIHPGYYAAVDQYGTLLITRAANT